MADTVTRAGHDKTVYHGNVLFTGLPGCGKSAIMSMPPIAAFSDKVKS
jgi:hypothetical protein